jgi:hypothetical protein
METGAQQQAETALQRRLFPYSAGRQRTGANTNE